MHTTRLIAFAATATLSLGACSSYLLEPSGSTRRSELMPRIASAYVALAASDDLLQIESGKLALQRSQDTAIRAHAEAEVRDHDEIARGLRGAAQAAGVGVPSAMMPMHRTMLEDLQRSGDFDAVYRRQQIASHRQSLAMHTNFASRGDIVGLRGVAANAVPVVRRHLEEAQRP